MQEPVEDLQMAPSPVSHTRPEHRVTVFVLQLFALTDNDERVGEFLWQVVYFGHRS